MLDSIKRVAKLFTEKTKNRAIINMPDLIRFMIISLSKFVVFRTNYNSKIKKA